MTTRLGSSRGWARVRAPWPRTRAGRRATVPSRSSAFRSAWPPRCTSLPLAVRRDRAARRRSGGSPRSGGPRRARPSVARAPTRTDETAVAGLEVERPDEVREVVGPHARPALGAARAPAWVRGQAPELARARGHDDPPGRDLAGDAHERATRLGLGRAHEPRVARERGDHRLEVEVAVRDVDRQEAAGHDLGAVNAYGLTRQEVHWNRVRAEHVGDEQAEAVVWRARKRQACVADLDAMAARAVAQIGEEARIAGSRRARPSRGRARLRGSTPARAAPRPSPARSARWGGSRSAGRAPARG